MTIGPNLSSGVSDDLAAVLDNLFSSESIVDAQGRPTRRFQQIWENAIGGLKTVLESQGASISELQAIYAGINAAQSTAAAAVQTAQTTASEQALAQSYTNPVGVLTASSAGVVTIATHERIYGNGDIVSVTGGSVGGFASGDFVTIHYNDPAREGGAVTYQGTTDAIAQNGATHVVGQVAIPSVGEADVPGFGPTAPGYTSPNPYDYDPRQIEYGYA